MISEQNSTGQTSNENMIISEENIDGVMDMGLLRSGFDSQASLVVVSTRKWPQESNSGLTKAVGLVKKKGKGVTHGSYTPVQVDRRPKGFLRMGRQW